MYKKAKVTADADGRVVIISKNNPEYGHIRIEQERFLIDDDGFLRAKVLSALLPGKIEELKRLALKANQEIDGSVYFKESLSPFNKKDDERDCKVAGKTGIVCCIDGQPIYRKTFFSFRKQMEDTLILDENGNHVLHTNVDEIREAFINLKAIENKETQAIIENEGKKVNSKKVTIPTLALDEEK